MNKTFTQKELNNTSVKKAKDLQGNVIPNEPRQQIINNILNYSKALSVTKSENLEHLVVVLN